MENDFKVGETGIVLRTGRVARVIKVMPNRYGHTRLMVEIWNESQTKREQASINSSSFRPMNEIRDEIKLFREVSLPKK